MKNEKKKVKNQVACKELQTADTKLFFLVRMKRKGKVSLSKPPSQWKIGHLLVGI